MALTNVTYLGLRSQSSTAITIAWKSNTDCDGYEIQRKLTGGTYSNLGSTTNSYYTDSAVSSGIVYYYRVRSYKTTPSDYSSYTTGISIKAITNYSTRYSILKYFRDYFLYNSYFSQYTQENTFSVPDLENPEWPKQFANKSLPWLCVFTLTNESRIEKKTHGADLDTFQISVVFVTQAPTTDDAWDSFQNLEKNFQQLFARDLHTKIDGSNFLDTEPDINCVIVQGVTIRSNYSPDTFENVVISIATLDIEAHLDFIKGCNIGGTE